MTHRGDVAALALAVFIPTSVMAQTAGTVLTSASPAEAKRDYGQISLEELLNKDIAVAATKTRVDVAKAPVSVTVLTPEDIRRSGAQTLGELLRTVPGLDVLESFPSYISVSARGTSESFVNNMLVLIDGRRLESLRSGVPFLDQTTMRLEDVKRIEVVKGPVGAVYGTNALAGVISITTYSASDVQGTLVSVNGGNRDSLDVTFRQAGKIGQSGWAYKFVSGYTYTSTWASMDDGPYLPPEALRKGSASLLLERRFADDSVFEVEGGYVKGDLASLTIVTNQTQYFTAPHLRAGYSRPNTHVLFTFSPHANEQRERVPPIQPGIDRWSAATSLSADHTLKPVESSTITLGGNLRYQSTSATNLIGAPGQVVGAVFAQDQQDVVKNRLTLFGAVGLSHHPEIPLQVDGNVALVATPVDNHSFRVSFGRAHRDPSFGENFINFRRKFGTADGYQAPNLDLNPETVRAYEVGYHGRLNFGKARLQIFAEGFKERLSDLINITTTTIAPGTLPDFPTATTLQQFKNIESRDGKGFEAGAEVSGTAARLGVQYAYQEFKNVATDAAIHADIPQHTFSVVGGYHHSKIEFDTWVHAVGKSALPSYVLVNPRLGLRLAHWTISAQSFNALNDRHVETVNGRGISGERIGRSVTGSVTYTSR